MDPTLPALPDPLSPVSEPNEPPVPFLTLPCVFFPPIVFNRAVENPANSAERLPESCTGEDTETPSDIPNSQDVSLKDVEGDGASGAPIQSLAPANEIGEECIGVYG